jgi:predicted nicotinamide N-methyase
VSALDDDRLRALLERHAPLTAVPLVPTLRAFRAADELPLWEALEAACGHRLDAPFFAVPWPGAQAVAHAFETGLVDVAGRRALEVGCGSGLASVAAARAGATVIATDIDALALQVTRLLARAHDVAVAVAVLDLLDGGAIERSLVDVDVVIAADVVYNRALGAAMKQLLERCRQRDIDVVVADSGRPFFDASGLRALAMHEVPVPVGVEGTGTRRVTVYTQA